MPELTVVIPTKDRPTMLPRALASVLEQVEDAEVVVVDDGSMAENAEAIEEACAVDPRVRLVRNPESLGPSGARNAAFELAAGLYVSTLDDDNIWLPGRWAAQRAVLEEHAFPHDLVVVCALRLAHADAPGVKDVPRIDAPQPIRGSLREVFARVGPRVFLNTYVASTALIRSVGGYDDRMWWGEQTDLLIRLSKVARFAGVQHPGVLVHRTHEESSWRAGRNWARKAEGIGLLLSKHEEAFATQPVLRGTYLHVMGVSQLRAGDRWGAAQTFWRVARSGPSLSRRVRGLGHMVLAAVGGPSLWRRVSRLRGIAVADVG
jgi:glycosyltransferase involved in cell wall biosynthesis